MRKVKNEKKYSRLMVSEDRAFARIGGNLVKPNEISTQLVVQNNE